MLNIMRIPGGVVQKSSDCTLGSVNGVLVILNEAGTAWRLALAGSGGTWNQYNALFPAI